MGYRQSNAAFAYDMQPAATPERLRQNEAPRVAERPSLHVVTGEGRQANQAVSPAFVSVIKVCCVLIALFCVVGLARVSLASATAATLNNNAALTNELETGRDESSNLEVMQSVYGSPTRIRDLASGTLGMVDAENAVELDLSGSAASSATEGQPSADQQ